MAVETAYLGKKLRVTHELFDGDTIFVTFQSAIGVGFHNEGFGQQFFSGRRISAIHVVSVDAAWYQYEEILDALAEVRKITSRFKRVITYGTSMGGYAASGFWQSAFLRLANQDMIRGLFHTEILRENGLLDKAYLPGIEEKAKSIYVDEPGYTLDSQLADLNLQAVLSEIRGEYQSADDFNPMFTKQD